MNKHKNKLICVIGGSGYVGKNIIKMLLEYTATDIRVLDESVFDPFEVFPEYSERITFKQVNLLRTEIIRDLIKDSDLVINTSGPFLRFGSLIAKTIIEAGINGIDICNDYSVTANILSFDGLAKKKRVSFLTGFGFSPGISNLLVMRAVQGMEKIDDVYINSVYPLNGLSGNALLEHFIYISLNKLPVLKKGKITLVPAFSKNHICNFPYPFKERKVSITGGPEVITLSEYMDINNISVKSSILPSLLEKAIKYSVYSGITQDDLSRKKLASLLSGVFRYSFFNRNNLSSLKIKVRGLKKRNYTEIDISSIDSFDSLVSYLAVASTIMLLNDELKNIGVFPPEGCLNENKTLNYIAKMGFNYSITEKFISI